ncbi:MAG: ion channel [Gemmatimonadaceae bacterium]|nr:ion channel [Gemmatimonadaceae bacterium]
MTTAEPRLTAAEEPKDLGFGTVVGQANTQRLLNRDGSFNVRRDGLPRLSSLSLYHALLGLSWPQFIGLLVGGYLVVNVLFALAYSACGPGALMGTAASTMGGGFLRAFFFSVHTFATIGYGNVVPMGLPANLLVTLETIVGLLGFAVSTGVLFARFARPTARVLFSARAVVAPYRGRTGFMFRLVNGRSNQLIELDVKVLFSRIEERQGARQRVYDQLKLERTHVVFFPLAWTVVHPIDESSPMWGFTESEFQACETEFLILLSAIDETFAQTVHARTSYRADEIAVGAKFVNIYNPRASDGSESIDISRLSEIERVARDAAEMHDTATWHHTGHFTGFAPPAPPDRRSGTAGPPPVS